VNRNENPRKPLYLQGLKLEAGVGIEPTIGVLQFVGWVSRRSLVFLDVPFNHYDPENRPKSGTQWNPLKQR